MQIVAAVVVVDVQQFQPRAQRSHRFRRLDCVNEHVPGVQTAHEIGRVRAVDIGYHILGSGAARRAVAVAHAVPHKHVFHAELYAEFGQHEVKHFKSSHVRGKILVLAAAVYGNIDGVNDDIGRAKHSRDLDFLSEQVETLFVELARGEAVGGERRVGLKRRKSARAKSSRNIAEFLYPDSACLGENRVLAMPGIAYRVVHAVKADCFDAVENLFIAEASFVAERALKILGNYACLHLMLLLRQVSSRVSHSYCTLKAAEFTNVFPRLFRVFRILFFSSGARGLALLARAAEAPRRSRARCKPPQCRS